jgi:hypothetical protein
MGNHGSFLYIGDVLTNTNNDRHRGSKEDSGGSTAKCPCKYDFDRGLDCSLIQKQLTASMWTPEEAQQIIAIAKEVIPDLKTFSLPQGLQVEKGPDAVVEYIKEHLPSILD